MGLDMKTMNRLLLLVVCCHCLSGCLGDEDFNVTKPISVAVILEPPFVMKDEKTGKFSGLLIDVLHAANIKIDHIDTVVGGKYGMEENPGQWNGIIGHLINGTYDLAVAPFLIRSKRSKAVTFSQPVIHSGYKVLYKIPSEWRPHLTIMTTLIQPFSTGLWIVIVVMGLLTSGIFYLIHRFSPYEDVTSAPALGWTNELVYTFGTLMSQSGRVPHMSLSGRLLTMVWWLFAMMTLGAYIAGLAVILFRENPHAHTLPFTSVDEMVRQTTVAVLGVKGSGTYRYMENHDGYLEQKVFNMWQRNEQSLLVDSMDTALEMMMGGDGKYAVLMEEATADYLASQEPCDKMVVGEPVGDQTFGFACQKLSAICDDLNHVILHLQETGQMQKLREKWFWGGCHKTASYLYGGSTYLDTFGGNGLDLLTPSALTLSRFSAAFLLLLLGVVAAVLVLVAEVFYARRKGNVRLVVSDNGDEDLQRITGRDE